MRGKQTQSTKPWVEAHQGGPAALHELSGSYAEISLLLLRRNDAKGAAEYGRRRVDFCRRIAAAQPGDAAAQKDLAAAYFGLGNNYEMLEQNPAAIAAYNQSIPIYETLARADPGSGEFRRRLMILYAEKGTLQFEKEKHAAHRNRMPSRPSNARMPLRTKR